MISGNVLIVDDNSLICYVLERTLSRMKVNIAYRSVPDGKHAISEISRAFYDLVFLDIHLPDANGLDLIPEIQRISPGTRVVVISSDGSEHNVRQALRRGAMRFLEKPWQIPEIREVLEAILSRGPAPHPPDE